MNPHEKALKKSKKNHVGSFFDSLDKNLGNGRFLTAHPRIAAMPKKRK